MRFVAFALLALVFVPARAAAQWGEAWLGDETAERAHEQLEMAATLESTVMVLDYDFDREPIDAHVESFSFVATVQARIVEAVGVELRVPYAMEHARVRGPRTFDPPPDGMVLGPDEFWRNDFGAPFVAAYWAPEYVDPERERRVRGRIGLGVSIPTADFPVLGDSYYDPLYVRVARAQWDDWLFRRSEGAVVVPGAVEARLWRYAYFGASGAAAVFWDDRSRQRAILQFGVEAGAEPLEWLRVSVRGTGVGRIDPQHYGLEWGSGDVAFALQPRVAAAYGPVLGWLAVTLPLNGVFGPDRPPYQPYAASVQLGLGGRW